MSQEVKSKISKPMSAQGGDTVHIIQTQGYTMRYKWTVLKKNKIWIMHNAYQVLNFQVTQ